MSDEQTTVARQPLAAINPNTRRIRPSVSLVAAFVLVPGLILPAIAVAALCAFVRA